jgi:Aspartyl protease/PDZ domain
MKPIQLLRRILFATSPFVCVICLWASAAPASDERILLDATINGKPVRLVFDTGASDLILFRKGAARLGLKVSEPPRDVKVAPGEVPVGRTEECDFALGASRVRTSFRVFEPPSFLHMGVDGAVGWQPIRYNIIQVNAGLNQARWLTNTPPEAATWLKFKIRSQSRILCLEIPGEEAGQGVLSVDTGSSCGVALNPERWQAWKDAHSNQPMSLLAGYMPGAGTVVMEEGWAKELTFGPLVLTDVPVVRANVAEQAMGAPGFEASLGLAALKRLDLIIDGVLGIAYLRPKTGPPPPYEHNRLGAVFAPPSMEGGDLVARVIEGSPAYEAGIRDGDVLLKVGNLDATKWRTDPKVLPLSRFWEQPPGTRLQLTLKRGNRTFKATAVLRQILDPAVGSPANGPRG